MMENFNSKASFFGEAYSQAILFFFRQSGRIFLFLLTLFSVLCPFSQSAMAQSESTPGGPDRIWLDSTLAPFFHGVASGDPLPDAVILWTRLTTPASTADTVYWEISTDTLFTSLLQSGFAMAMPARDFTVKVDVQGLQPDRWYYYRFRHQNAFSLMGRTRTAPAPSSQTEARFAVLACSNYQDGFFNAYRDIVRQNEVDAVLHLGDYLYEYGINDFSPGIDSSRLHSPSGEIFSLGEYRARHSQYKLDEDLREIHRQFPFICIWDDHETANDAWTGGAQNHTEASEGPWEERKNAGRQAYYDWMPIRDRVSGQTDTIRRQLHWGGLISLILLDTRLEGRQQQIGTSGAAVNDTNRTLLGSEQLAWLKAGLAQSTARWKLIGNQVMISPLRILGSAVNQDQWDGYPAERTKVLRFIRDNNIDNVVFLTGDIHTSWANDVPLDLSSYNGSTGAGSVASEMVCSSVTSSSFVNFSVPVALIRAFNPNVKYAELSKKGYLTLQVKQAEVQGDWVHMSTVQNRNFNRSIASSWKTVNQANRLVQATSPIPPRQGMPPLAPEFVQNVSAVKPKQTASFHTLIASFNPGFNTLTLQLYRKENKPLTVVCTSLEGKTIFSHTFQNEPKGIWEKDIRLPSFSGNMILVKLWDGKTIQSMMVPAFNR